MDVFAGFSIWMALLCAIGGYLLGNIQTSIIISKLYFHDDVRAHGSGNAGSTNMLRVFGVKPGLMTFLGDFCKAVASVLLGRLLMGTLGGEIAGLFTVAGHCWPALAGFRGGKGVASTFGVAVLTFPLGALTAFAVGGVLLALTKRVSLMSLSGVTAFLIMMLLFRMSEPSGVILAALLFIIVMLRHAENIKRLLKGEEKPIRNS